MSRTNFKMPPTLSFTAKDFTWFDGNGNPIINDWVIKGKPYPLERRKFLREILGQELHMEFNPEFHSPVELAFLYTKEELAQIHKDIGLCIIMNAMNPHIRSELLERRPRKKCLRINYAQQTFQNKETLMEEIRQSKYRKPFEKALVRRLDKYTYFPTDISIIIAQFAHLPPYNT